MIISESLLNKYLERVREVINTIGMRKDVSNQAYKRLLKVDLFLRNLQYATKVDNSLYNTLKF